MRTFTLVLVTALLTILTAFSQSAFAQEKERHFEVEVEPVAYILKGAGITGAYQSGKWTYSIEAFGLELPESLHGNDNFTASMRGIEFQLEAFLDGNTGFFVGPEIGVTDFEVTHEPSDKTEERINLSIGFRGGYKWYTGLGNLYLSPVAGLGYSLNGQNIEIEDDTFESGKVTPWATVGIGWTF